MTALVLRAHAGRLPLPDESVDLIVTSPPYFAQRSYRDGGEHYEGQLGSEPTPHEFLEALRSPRNPVVVPGAPEPLRLSPRFTHIDPVGFSTRQHSAVTARKLPPERRAMLDDDERRIGATSLDGTHPRRRQPAVQGERSGGLTSYTRTAFGRAKSKMLLPHRYAIGCEDGLADPEGIGWIVRQDQVWQKVNGLPEPTTDRTHDRHEYVFHLCKRGDYYGCVDPIREPHSANTHARRKDGDIAPKDKVGLAAGVRGEGGYFGETTFHPLGRAPGSVWTITNEPLRVPDHLAIEHFAAYPTELCRRIIAGWSPSGICTACGSPRRPVTVSAVAERRGAADRVVGSTRDAVHGSRVDGRGGERIVRARSIEGEACDCTPFEDHPERRRPTSTPKREDLTHRPAAGTGRSNTLPPPGPPVREYDLDNWAPPPTRPAVVLDPFGGTGTTALAAHVLGRVGISVDLSLDYCRLADWRIHDREQAAKIRRRENEAAQLGLVFGEPEQVRTVAPL